MRTVTALLLAVALLPIGCTRSDGTDEPKLQVRVAVLNHILATSFVAASLPDAQGRTCFDEAGVLPVINKRSRGPEIVDAIVSGSVDVGTLAITPQALQIAQGTPLVAFATYQTSDLDIKFVARKSTGITSPGLVRGKRLGYVGGTYGEIFMDRYLQKLNVAKTEVTLTSGTPAVLRDLFVNGSLDAIIVWEPTIQDLIRDPGVDASDLLIDVDRSIYTARVNLIAMPDALNRNRVAAERLVQALICAETHLREEPSRVQHSLEKWMDRQQGSLDGVFHPETFNVVLDVNALKSDLASETAWARDAVFAGKATVPTDLGAFIDAEVVRKVAPSRLR
jgi:ABC-type nitrate/sulfonate/bicarbonate transport system substrate-binding protein